MSGSSASKRPPVKRWKMWRSNRIFGRRSPKNPHPDVSVNITAHNVGTLTPMSCADLSNPSWVSGVPKPINRSIDIVTPQYGGDRTAIVVDHNGQPGACDLTIAGLGIEIELRVVCLPSLLPRPVSQTFVFAPYKRLILAHRGVTPETTQSAGSRLHLALEFIEKAPVGVLGNELVRTRLDQAHLVQPQCVETQRVL